MDLKEIAFDMLEKGHTVILRQEPDGTLELTATKGISPQPSKRPAPAADLIRPAQIADLIRKRRSKGRGKGVTVSAEDLAEIKRLRKSGLSYPEISLRTGWSKSTIGGHLR